MAVWQVILLGILQGVTEFLPVSSSGHLVIVPHLLGWPDPGLAVDAMLHLGTLTAIIVYFWRDLWQLVGAALKSLQQRSLADPMARVAWGLAIATIPGAVLGLLLEDFFEQLFGSPQAAAGFLLGTAALLLYAEYAGTRRRPMTALAWVDAIVIGLAQALAIAPGMSRSGATISAGLLLGFRREDAARFSFLLAVPITLGSGLYQVAKLATGTPVNAGPVAIVAGLIAAAVAGYLAIAGLLALIRRHGLVAFAIYCIVLSLLVLSGLLV